MYRTDKLLGENWRGIKASPVPNEHRDCEHARENTYLKGKGIKTTVTLFPKIQVPNEAPKILEK